MNDGVAFWKTGFHVIISCQYLQTWEQLAEALGNAFQFPMRNEGLDGTWDWLTDLTWLGKQDRICIYFFEAEKLLQGNIALMHMGAMAVLGANRPKNIVHIIINNEAHDTVGGQPTAIKNADICKIAEGCGYIRFKSVSSFLELDKTLCEAKEKNELSLIEIKSDIGARKDLGRPTTTAKQNKRAFMEHLKNND